MEHQITWDGDPEDVYVTISGVATVEGVTGDRLRTALTRAATAAGVPVFSPHDLRHRRVSLLHLAGAPWARIGEGPSGMTTSPPRAASTHTFSPMRRSSTTRGCSIDEPLEVEERAHPIDNAGKRARRYRP
jgi:hypothetical protein